MPNGPVNAILAVSNTVYLGGEFSYVGPRTGPAVLFDQATGETLASPPRINGTVRAAVSDGVGGWYIGGSFTRIGGSPVTNLAHLNPDLSLDASWNGRVIGTAVNALALDDNCLYVGGQFTRIGGLVLSGLAGLSRSNAAITWNPQFSGSAVNAMQLTNGLLYVGGVFSSVGSSNRQNLAAISVSTALANAWDPYPDGTVLALQVIGDTVYVGGTFTYLNNGTKSRNRLGAVDTTTGAATTWNPNPNGTVRALAAGPGTVYVGGDFTTISVQSRRGFAALNRTGTGAAQALNLQIQSAGTVNLVRGILPAGDSLYVVGQFNGALGTPQVMLVGVDTTTSLTLPTPLATDFNGAAGAAFGINAIAIADGRVLVAGDFQSMGGVMRQRAAALSLETGAPLDWAPTFDAPVLCLAQGTNCIYVGGSFTNLSTSSGTNRVPSLAAVDPVNGTNMPFTFLGTNGSSPVIVQALAVRNDMLYVGGAFTVVGNQARRFLAAVDPETGAPIASFNASLGGGSVGVTSLALSGANLYVAGDFTTVSAVPRPRLAAVVPATGAAIDWTPSPSQIVNVLASSADSLYVGGQFTTINGVALRNFAAYSTVDNSILFLDAALPTSANGVQAIGASPTVLYVGGSFSAIGGENRQYLGCLSASEALAYDWNPCPDAVPSTITLTENLILLGGSFRFVGQSPTNQVCGFFAVYDRTPQTTISKSAGQTVQVTTTTGDRTEAVLQGTPTLTSPVWSNLATNTPGSRWTMSFPSTSPQQFFRVVAR